MKKLTCCLLAAVLALFACLGLAACRPEDDGVIRLNEVTHSIFYTPQYLAMALGYFEEENLTIELTNGGGADKTMTALLTGEADIGLCGPEPGIYVYLEGRENYVKVVGQLTKRDGSFLVSRTSEPGFDWSGLEGKEILMGRRGGMPAMILQYVLNNHGYVDGQNITMNYEIQFNMLAPAFTGGAGDYVPLFEPTASQLAKEGKGFIVAGIGRESGEIPYTCYQATKTYIAENGDKITRFLRAVYKGKQYLMTHDNEHIAELLMPHFPGTDRAMIVSALDNYKAYDTWAETPVMKETSYTRLQDVLENAGELSRRVDFFDLVDNTMAIDAVGD